MVLKKSILPLALVASFAIAVPAGTAVAKPSDPVAHSAGGDAPPLTPAVVGVPVTRTGSALDAAANAIDEGKGATAAGPLKASRKYLIRSYKGAKYLIANAPPAPADDASAASSKKFVRLARRFVRSSRSGGSSARGWIRAQASQDDAAGPVFADAPTAVFSVFTSQYDAATTAIGMAPDTTGNLLNRVKTTLNTAIVLRNRLVKIVAAAAPPAPADDARVEAHASQDDVTTFDMVMPGLAVLLNDEIQQMQASVQDNTVPAASNQVLSSALAADNQILTRVNTLWPPVVDD
ncbi:MAG: hypothetical protein M3O25_11490 [Actinomycetota bacterium]|nr:hypothetical protein [Actinomycetota bacterium]